MPAFRRLIIVLSSIFAPITGGAVGAGIGGLLGLILGFCSPFIAGALCVVGFFLTVVMIPLIVMFPDNHWSNPFYNWAAGLANQIFPAPDETTFHYKNGAPDASIGLLHQWSAFMIGCGKNGVWWGLVVGVSGGCIYTCIWLIVGTRQMLATRR